MLKRTRSAIRASQFSLREFSEKTKARSYWADRLRELKTVLAKKERRAAIHWKSGRVPKDVCGSQTEFQKKTAQWQIEDTEKNLTRATAERKKAEQERVVAEAAKKGFKAEDLKKGNSVANRPNEIE
jgi:hypothetical protein